jgi:hypothetical protein
MFKIIEKINKVNREWKKRIEEYKKFKEDWFITKKDKINKEYNKEVNEKIEKIDKELERFEEKLEEAEIENKIVKKFIEIIIIVIFVMLYINEYITRERLIIFLLIISIIWIYVFIFEIIYYYFYKKFKRIESYEEYKKWEGRINKIFFINYNLFKLIDWIHLKFFLLIRWINYYIDNEIGKKIVWIIVYCVYLPIKYFIILYYNFLMRIRNYEIIDFFLLRIYGLIISVLITVKLLGILTNMWIMIIVYIFLVCISFILFLKERIKKIEEELQKFNKGLDANYWYLVEFNDMQKVYLNNSLYGKILYCYYFNLYEKFMKKIINISSLFFLFRKKFFFNEYIYILNEFYKEIENNYKKVKKYQIDSNFIVDSIKLLLDSLQYYNNFKKLQENFKEYEKEIIKKNELYILNIKEMLQIILNLLKSINFFENNVLNLEIRNLNTIVYLKNRDEIISFFDNKIYEKDLIYFLKTDYKRIKELSEKNEELALLMTENNWMKKEDLETYKMWCEDTFEFMDNFYVFYNESLQNFKIIFKEIDNKIEVEIELINREEKIPKEIRLSFEDTWKISFFQVKIYY